MIEYELFHNMLNEVCAEKGIKMTLLSFDYIIKLEKDDNVRYIFGRHFDGNTGVFYKVASDKYALYEVLKSCDIDIIEHKMLFNPVTRADFMTNDELEKQMKEYADKYNNNIIVKSNDGYSGKEVFRFDTYEGIRNKVYELFKQKDAVSLCPFYNFKNEYRIIYLDGNCELIFAKERPYVIGDGTHSVYELYKEHKGVFSEYLTEDKFANIDLEYIPKENEKVLLSWKHNLYNGAIPRIEDDENMIGRIKDKLEEINSKLKTFFASVDLVELEDGTLSVIEINTSVHMDIFVNTLPNGYNIVKNIYSDVLDKYFN